MTDADKVMNPQHFGRNLADIRIRIRINLEIWNRIPDHYWLRLDALVRFALSEHSLVLTKLRSYNTNKCDRCNREVIVTSRWHVTISCQPDGRPPQPVRPWKNGRVHLAECSKVVVLELLYSTEFGRESRKFASGVRKYGKFDDGRWQTRRAAGIISR